MRLFNYTLEMRSIDHRGLLFDNLSFSNFGYGGDPNDVSRLRIDKNKWYDFQLLFRRDKNFWDYNLFANPLNPATSKPAIALVNSPNSLDLVRRMQDYNLTLLPQSRVRFRLGYSRNVNEGPGLESYDSGVLPLFTTDYRTTENAYRAGVDFRFLPKTTLSYDQYLAYDKQDNITADNNLTYLSARLAFRSIWESSGILPAARPAPRHSRLPLRGLPTPPATESPPIRGRAGRAFLRRPSVSAFNPPISRISRCPEPRAIAPATIRSPDFSEVLTGLTTRTDTRGSTTSGPAVAKRVSVNADLGRHLFNVTEKLRIDDAFRYDNWRIPGVWNGSGRKPVLQFRRRLSLDAASDRAVSLRPPSTRFARRPTRPPPARSMRRDPARTSTTEVNKTFSGPEPEAEHVSGCYTTFRSASAARVGYRYTNRKIAHFSSSFNTAEIYFPGRPDRHCNQ